MSERFIYCITLLKLLILIVSRVCLKGRGGEKQQQKKPLRMKRNGHVAINYFIMRYEERILNIISSNTVEQTIYLLEIVLQWWMACFKIETSLMGAFQRISDTQSNSQLLLYFNRNRIPYFCQRVRRVNPICKYLHPDDPQTITNSKLSKTILVITPFAK